MSKLVKKHSKKAGLPPGSLVYTGESTGSSIITVIDYDQDNFKKEIIENVDKCLVFKEKPTVTWINIDGLGQVDIVDKIGTQFGIHPLVLEDILHTGQRPKCEDYQEHIFVVLNMITYNEKKADIDHEQVSIVIGSNFVISFQERPGDVFDIIRDRIQNSKGRIRAMKADYLAYCLIDAIVDNYFSVLEKIAEKIESLEDELTKDPDEKTVRQIHNLKRMLIFLRKSVWPLRESINNLKRLEHTIINEPTRIYFNDIYDHTIQIIDTIETFRDMVAGMIDIYLSSVSNKMNSVMKVLTIIATIFIPLSFFAGVYGMNFQHMPELSCKWMYPFGFWLFIFVIAAFMLILFKRKKWL